MTALKAHEVQRFLARPDISEGIFLAYGPDAGLVREVGQTLTRRFAGDDGDGPVVLDGNEVDADPTRLAVEAKTPSLFGGRRVIRVRSTSKSLVMALSELKEDMAGAAIVVEAGNLAPSDPLRVLVETAKVGRALPCYPDSDETLERLINETFSKAGIAADPDVAPTLRDILGNDREVTRRELEKLELFATDTKVLTRNDVLTLCADNATLAVDDISDAIGTGHAAELEDALRRALAAAVDGQQIVGSVARHFAQLRRWRAEVDHGKSPREVLDNARPKPHFSRRSSLEQQVRLWTDSALATATDRLWQGVSDARKTYDLSETVVRRTLLAVCKQAAEH